MGAARTAFGTKSIPDRVAERAATRCTTRLVVASLGECYESTYSTASHGYAQIGWAEGGRNHGTTCQRAAWQHWNGPIPDGLTVDHRCRNRPCVRREHLRLRPNSANASDNGQQHINAPTGARCGCGGPYVQGSTSASRPYCRSCQNRRRRVRRAAGVKN